MEELSGEERRAAFHELARASLPEFGLDGGSLTLLGDLVNASFRVQHASGAWYLRVYSPGRHDTRAIRSEFLFLEALAESGFPAPRPLRRRDGELLWVSSRSPVAGAMRIAVYSWLPGEMLQYDKTRQHYEALGSLLAALHGFSAAWKPPEEFTRPRCDSEGIYGDQGASGQVVMRGWANVSGPLRADLERAQDALRQAEGSIGADAARYGVIHADPSFGNVLFDGRRPSLIDFDDCGYGHFVFDLAVVLAGAWGKPGFDENRAALLEGYRRTRELSREEVAALPAAMAARAASLILWAAGQSSRHRMIEGQWQRLREYMASG